MTSSYFDKFFHNILINPFFVLVEGSKYYKFIFGMSREIFVNNSLTSKARFRILLPQKSKFLARQPKSGDSGWLRSQPDNSQPNIYLVPGALEKDSWEFDGS